MSEPEGFLTRWSRRKREADEPAPDAKPSEQPAAPESAGADAVTETRAAESTTAAGEALEFDLSMLPPLESITATTDIRAFLLPGVPAELTRAALRRAWVADPAIREFIGLAENAWDFTAPDTVPGFGSSVPADVARRLIAGMAGGSEPAAPEPDVPPESMAKPDVSTTGDAEAAATAAAERAPTDDVPADAEDRAVDVAMHKEEARDEPPRPPGRGHGSALPR